MSNLDNLNSSRRRVPEATTESGSSDVKDKSWFVVVSIWQYVIVLTGMFAFYIFCYHTYLFPFEALGGPGQRLAFLRDNYMPQMVFGFYLACLIHIAEAIYAAKVCVDIGLDDGTRRKWAFQTFLLGYCSLRFLVEKNKQMSKKQ